MWKENYLGSWMVEKSLNTGLVWIAKLTFCWTEKTSRGLYELSRRLTFDYFTFFKLVRDLDARIYSFYRKCSVQQEIYITVSPKITKIYVIKWNVSKRNCYCYFFWTLDVSVLLWNYFRTSVRSSARH